MRAGSYLSDFLFFLHALILFTFPLRLPSLLLLLLHIYEFYLFVLNQLYLSLFRCHNKGTSKTKSRLIDAAVLIAQDPSTSGLQNQSKGIAEISLEPSKRKRAKVMAMGNEYSITGFAIFNSRTMAFLDLFDQNFENKRLIIKSNLNQ